MKSQQVNQLIIEGKNLQGQSDIEDLIKSVYPKLKHQKIELLDISNNLLRKGLILHSFTKLNTLILDNNIFYTLEGFPKIASLITFSANKNLFYNLELFLYNFKLLYPNVQHLSLLKNPLNPFFLSDEQYLEFKKTVLSTLRSIKFLDGLPVEYNILTEESKQNEEIKQNLKKLN